VSGRYALVAARWNAEWVDRLVAGARQVLLGNGVAADAIETFAVPGALELPLACRWAADSGRFDAVLAFGVVMRGETEHFRLVADAATAGLQRVALDSGVPVLHGVLAAHDLEQVTSRTGGAHGNRGAEVALAALQMAALRRTLGPAAPARPGSVR